MAGTQVDAMKFAFLVLLACLWSVRLALLVYLKLTRDYGPSLVSLANFISLFFAAMIGTVFFDDNLTWPSAFAGVLLVAALTMRNQENRGRT